MADKAMIESIATQFTSSQKLLTALGDENRQHLILEMMKTGNCNGVRVVEITKKTNLSRPAVSHHLQILKDSGIIKMRREGTKNYYYFDVDATAIDSVISMLADIKTVMQSMPDRSGDD